MARLGAINGMGPNGQALHENEQVEEVWTGTTFAIASHMLSEGMRDQAFHTAHGVYNVVWKERGYLFRTPEAYDAHGKYRASVYATGSDLVDGATFKIILSASQDSA